MQIRSFKTPPAKSHPLDSFVKIVLLLIAIVVAGFFGKQAWDEHRRWENSVEVEAEVVAVSPPPPEPFPSKYHLAYQDNSGVAHELDLEQSDLYGIPKVGDKVTLHYLSDSPQIVKGPAKIHDVVMEKYAPYFITIVGVYLAMHFMVDLVLGQLLKKTRART